jgi:hypothetical protein
MFLTQLQKALTMARYSESTTVFLKASQFYAPMDPWKVTLLDRHSGKLMEWLTALLKDVLMGTTKEAVLVSWSAEASAKALAQE